MNDDLYDTTDVWKQLDDFLHHYNAAFMVQAQSGGEGNPPAWTGVLRIWLSDARGEKEWTTPGDSAKQVAGILLVLAEEWLEENS